MKINVKKEKTVSFVDIKYNEVFKYGLIYYLKIDTKSICISHRGIGHAINLNDGKIHSFNFDTLVIPCNAELSIL